jgi:hypothetical protein
MTPKPKPTVTTRRRPDPAPVAAARDRICRIEDRIAETLQTLRHFRQQRAAEKKRLRKLTK